MNKFGCFLIIVCSLLGANSMGIDILGTSSSSSPSAVSEMFSDVKNIIGMGTGGLDEVMGDGNTRYLQDFTNGGVSEMIR